MPTNEQDEAELAAHVKDACAPPATPPKSVEDAVWQQVRKRLSSKHDTKVLAPVISRRLSRWWLAASTVAAALLIATLVAFRGDPSWDMAAAPATSKTVPAGQSRTETKHATAPEASPGKSTRSYLRSIEDAQPADTLSPAKADLVIPPDLPEKAKLGDHHETGNPERPDTKSAFGNPDAITLAGKPGQDDAAGGGGSSGDKFLDIADGRTKGMPGTGGGFGGGEGTRRQVKEADRKTDLPIVPPTEAPMVLPRLDQYERVLSKDPVFVQGPLPGKESGRKDTSDDSARSRPGDSVTVLPPTTVPPDTRGSELDKLKQDAAELQRKIAEAEAATSRDTRSVNPYVNLPEIKPNVQVLSGGVQDDNAEFGKFLGFLQQTSAPGAIKQDISERVMIEITDVQGLPLTNADVRITSNGRTVHKARTYSNGVALFHPRVVGVDAQSQEFRVEVVPPPGCQGQAVVQDFRGRSGTWQLQVPYSRAQNATKLDILLCLDCTGSMADEIERIQKTLQMMVAKFNALPGKPQTRWGLVQYRDRGDQYVTKVHDFTDDVQKFQKKLDECKADAGGDEPESVNEALDKAVEGVSWDRSDAIRLIFLVGDAPPHMDYQDDVKYTESMAKAQRRAIKIYPLAASGLNKTGELIFRQLAQSTLAKFLFISYGGSTPHEVSKPGQSNNLDDLIVHIVASEVNARATARRAPFQIEDPDRWQK